MLISPKQYEKDFSFLQQEVALGHIEIEDSPEWYEMLAQELRENVETCTQMKLDPQEVKTEKERKALTRKENQYRSLQVILENIRNRVFSDVVSEPQALDFEVFPAGNGFERVQNGKTKTVERNEEDHNRVGWSLDIARMLDEAFTPKEHYFESAQTENDRPQYSVILFPGFNRAVFVCNQYANATYLCDMADWQKYAQGFKVEDVRSAADAFKQNKELPFVAYFSMTPDEATWRERLIFELGEKVVEVEEKEGKEKMTKEEKEKATKHILEAEGVIEIQEKEGKRVLIWKTTINPQKKYQGYKSFLKTFLGNTGKHKSFASIVSVIRDLYECDREEFLNKDIEFEMASKERKVEMIKELLEAEGVVEVGKEEGKRVLVWKKPITPGYEYQGYKSPLETLLEGNKDTYTNFKSIVPVIRKLYRCETEIFANKDIEFEMASKERKVEMIKELLEAEEVVEVGREERERVLVWKKSINPTRKYQGYKFPLSTLLGNATEYQSFKRIIFVIRELYNCEKEVFDNKDIEFEMASKERKAEMVQELLEAEGIVEVQKKDGKRILVWKKIISPCNKYQGYKFSLRALLGSARQYQSFASVISVIRSLYQFDSEEDETGKVL